MLIVDINAKFHNKEDDCFPKEQSLGSLQRLHYQKEQKKYPEVQCMLHIENLDELKATMEL